MGELINDYVDDGDDDDYLLLNKVEAHGNHGDAEEEVERAEGDPLLPVLHLLVRGQVSETNGRQGDEAEVGAETDNEDCIENQNSTEDDLENEAQVEEWEDLSRKGQPSHIWKRKAPPTM